MSDAFGSRAPPGRIAIRNHHPGAAQACPRLMSDSPPGWLTLPDYFSRQGNSWHPECSARPGNDSYQKMKLSPFTLRLKEKSRVAFTLVEAVVAMAIVGVVFVSLYSGMATGFGMIRTARETLNAAQILEEKFETIRLY